MTVRVSVNYNDPRWKRFDLTSYVGLLLSKVVQIHQMRINNFSLSVLACSDSKIKELNGQYREKNKATNVLAWPATHCFFYRDQDFWLYGKNNHLFLGDIAISYERCLREASFHNIHFNRYCCKLLVHAITTWENTEGVIGIVGREHLEAINWGHGVHNLSNYLHQ